MIHWLANRLDTVAQPAITGTVRLFIDRYFRKPGNFAVRPVLQKKIFFII